MTEGGEEGNFERAEIHFENACELDRQGHTEDADEEFRHAAALAPEEFRAPLRLGRRTFEKIVAESLDSIPERFDQYLRQVVVTVHDYPDETDALPDLLGLYVGIPRTERSHEFRDHLDRVFIFKRNLEIDFPDPDELREEIRKTVVHEIAHHFGMTDEEMGEYA